jgi:TonB family protein
MLGCGEPGVVCLKALQVPTPHYPNTARARRLSANVVVMALVDERGRVIQTRVDSGSFAFFNDAAVEAAKRATFQPATRQGVPGRSWARLTFKFDQP